MSERLAPAKINLALHVTGQRDDGYHLLDSLVTFAEIGDRLGFQTANSLSLMETGPFSQQLAGEGGNNLVLRAAEALGDFMKERGRPAPVAAITLEKNLPVASGIGGGSADAAATLLGLNAMAQHPATQADLVEIAISLGADVPMCLTGQSARISGIGEDITPVQLPSFTIVMVNPGTALATSSVFAALREKQNKSLGDLPDGETSAAWIDWMREQRNDLQEPASMLAPSIEPCLLALKQTENCTLARMSGSGATCFGLYTDQQSADNAAAYIADRHPEWWVVSTRTSGAV